MKTKIVKREETPADRGKFKGVAYKKFAPYSHEVRLTKRKKATITDLKKEIVRVSQATDSPVTIDEVGRVLEHLLPSVINLLISVGEVAFGTLGSLCNLYIDPKKRPKRFHSSDENFKKIGKTLPFIKTSFKLADAVKARMNSRKTTAEKLKIYRGVFTEKRRIKEQATKEEDAALALIQLWTPGDNIDAHLDKYDDMIYWNDFSCFHSVAGNKVSQLPPRRDAVRDRLLSMLVDIDGGSRYISIWDEFMSIPALEARGIPPQINKWPKHDWSHEGYVSWQNKRGKGF